MIIDAGLMLVALVVIVITDSTVHYAVYCVLTKGKTVHGARGIISQFIQCLGLFVWFLASYISAISALLSPKDAYTYGSWIGAIIVAKRFPNQPENQKIKDLTESARNREKPESPGKRRKFHWVNRW